MPIDITTITLGELLASNDPIIRRNAMSILKTLQRLNNNIAISPRKP